MLQTTKVFDRIAKNHRARTQILQGGTSSSKTYSILQYLIYLASVSTSSLIISVVSETLPHLKRGVMRDFWAILGDSYDVNMHNKTDNIYKIGNSIIEFFSADNPGRVRGPRRDILFLNEANNISYDVFTQLDIRTSRKIFIDFNPTSEFWAHELIKNNDVSFDISTYLDNEYCPKAVVRTIEARRYNADGTETDWWRIYGRGQIGEGEGVIYTGWQQIDFPEFFNVIPTYGLDFGFSNDPTALCETHLQGANEMYVRELIYETGLYADDISRKMDVMGLQKNRTGIYADPSNPMAIGGVRREGWSIKGAVGGKDSVKTGIDWIQTKKLFVAKDSLNLIKELRNYKWMRNPGTGKYVNIPIDDWNHLLDAMRYSVSYKLRNSMIITKRTTF